MMRSWIFKALMMILRPGNGLEEFGAYELTPNSFFITIQKESFNVLSFKLFQEFLLIIIIRNNMINIIE